MQIILKGAIGTEVLFSVIGRRLLTAEKIVVSIWFIYD